jgi:hypothetical protein
MSDSDCSQVSVMNHWYAIQHDVNVFDGCVAKIEARNQTGCSIDDKIYQYSCIYLFLGLLLSCSCEEVVCTTIFESECNFANCECMCNFQER